MADLGDLIGSLMVGVIRARRMADEQTAVLAEYYKTNPLLEGLSVPRIRIPELTIDMPFLIEDQVEGEAGKLADTAKIAEAAQAQLKSTLDRHNITIEPAAQRAFISEVRKRLAVVKRTDAPVTKETVVRSVQSALADTLAKTKTPLTAAEKDTIARDLRASVAAVSIAKEPVASSIKANIKTAEVKERASTTTVVRLKITLKEEGLEWATQASESGGVVRTLQPE